jgi:hypothetical protein
LWNENQTLCDAILRSSVQCVGLWCAFTFLLSSLRPRQHKMRWRTLISRRPLVSRTRNKLHLRSLLIISRPLYSLGTQTFNLIISISKMTNSEMSSMILPCICYNQYDLKNYQAWN